MLGRIKGQLKAPLKDAAAVNVTRWTLFNALKAFCFPIETRSGALTKFNRHTFDVPKAHWLDVLCAGRINGVYYPKDMGVLEVRCTGRGSYQRTRFNRYGFPRGFLMRQKRVHGFATGRRSFGEEGWNLPGSRGCSRIRQLQHSDARGRHSRHRLASLPTAFFQRWLWVCVASPRTSFLPRLKTGVS